MRSKPLLPALLLVGAGLSPLAQASSDDSCYPDWSLVGGGVCDTLPFLAPGNDTRANLRLLLADGTRLDSEDPASVAAFRASHGELLERLAELGRETRANAELAAKIRHKYRLKNTTGLSLNALVDYDEPLD
ncbi:hypothetical protein AB9L62_23680, partial [Escherichia coli]|uniref:hypothetical protein n=1 Tax=Escherichia coli TaxID=562 RepID=UPI003526D58A